jgi:citrate synthase
MASQSGMRIEPPRQLYTGHTRREYADIQNRK